MKCQGGSPLYKQQGIRMCLCETDEYIDCVMIKSLPFFVLYQILKLFRIKYALLIYVFHHTQSHQSYRFNCLIQNPIQDKIVITVTHKNSRTHTYPPTHSLTHTHIHIHIHTQTHTHTHTYIYIYIYIYIYNMRLCVHVLYLLCAHVYNVCMGLGVNNTVLEINIVLLSEVQFK